MIPETQELARQIAVLIQLHPDKEMSEIAGMMGYSPIFTINALEYGVSQGYYTKVPKTDKVVLNDDADLDFVGRSLGEEIYRVQNEIVRAVDTANAQETDISIDLLRYGWLQGLRESALELALWGIEADGRLNRYVLADPADKKSTYDFLTLPDNLGKEWGAKQFQAPTGKTKKRK